MKADELRVGRQRIFLVTTATLASLGMGLATTHQAKADSQVVSDNGTVATVTASVTAQQLATAQTAVTQTSSAASTAQIVADQARATDAIAQSAVASAQSTVDTLSEAVSAAQLVQTVSAATSTVSAATSSATSGLDAVAQPTATSAHSAIVAQPASREENGVPTAEDEDSFATDLSTYETTASLLYTLYGNKIPDHDSSERNGLDASTVQSAIDSVATDAEQQVIPDGWEVLVSGAAYASDGVVYYNTANTQFGTDVDRAAQWWNQNAGQTVFQRADASHPATAYVTDYLNAHFSMLATTGTDGMIGLDLSLIEAFNYDPYNVIVHEMGHLLGLGHAPGANDIMNASVPRETFGYSQYDRIAVKAAIKAYQTFLATAHGNATAYRALSGYTPLSDTELALLSNPNFDQWHSLRSQLRTVAQKVGQLAPSTVLSAAIQTAMKAANTLVVNAVTLTQVKAGVSALFDLYTAMGKDSTDMFTVLNVNLSATTIKLETTLRDQLLGATVTNPVTDPGNETPVTKPSGETSVTDPTTQPGDQTPVTEPTTQPGDQTPVTDPTTQPGDQTPVTDPTTQPGDETPTTTPDDGTQTPPVTTDPGTVTAAAIQKLTEQLRVAQSTLKVFQSVAMATSTSVQIANRNYQAAKQRAEAALIRYAALEAIEQQEQEQQPTTTSGATTPITDPGTAPVDQTPTITLSPGTSPSQETEPVTVTPASNATEPSVAATTSVTDTVPVTATTHVLPRVRDRPMTTTILPNSHTAHNTRNNQLPQTSEGDSDIIFIGFVTLVMAFAGLFGVKQRRNKN